MDTPNIGTFPFIDYDDSLYLKNTERGSIFSSDTELPHVNVFPDEIEPDSLNMDTPNIGNFSFIDYDDSLYLKNTGRGSIFSSDSELPHVNESNVFPEEIEPDSSNMDTPNIGTFPFIDYDDSLYLKNTEGKHFFIRHRAASCE
ncbi:hypothetical protein JTE90_016804 [Oedothorax gibbosus]|uniref:Uncharacterized protein n=1 Tax=Oedothorax gibbosus TaxID=931172 RepID=A0AAV6VWK3_9ARAC|nr:hypothetical protein JTE90_016804 [Oedothorax gibbosus]